MPPATQRGVTAIATDYDHNLALKLDDSVGDVGLFQRRPGAVEAKRGVAQIAASPEGNVTYYRLGLPGDLDKDGLSDAAETQTAALGFDPLLSQPTPVAALRGAGDIEFEFSPPDPTAFFRIEVD
ncbi:hypothetical protein [Luteolibacter luteus]|uniref:Uncharacterized protein n=1 Tax=Luteolibacter luteus TaxID=2728835 RepID=A0A858RMJ8_9BACT|nr:hypothetical protein [Luteolibacter luteus]QJE98626.1 hypothetical protein HHL09_23520 [Luteolibacter luteus]